jgi:hypothetical protein
MTFPRGLIYGILPEQHENNMIPLRLILAGGFVPMSDCAERLHLKGFEGWVWF